MNTTTKTKEMSLNGIKVTSAAQAMTVIAYGDCNKMEKAGIPFRCLNFRTECHDYNDFEKCIELIDSYNEFDAGEMKSYLRLFLDLKKFYNDKNPNNGNSFFKFEIARESSPAFYVSFVPMFDKNIIDEDNNIKPYTKSGFSLLMENLKDMIKADEMDITEDYRVIARFWFD